MESTVKSLIASGTAQLSAVSDSAKLDTQILLAHVLNKDHTFLLTWPDTQLSSLQYQTYQASIERRLLGEPIAYIIGMKEFWSLPLQVSPATLIPRPDTEVLVESVLHYSAKFSSQMSNFWCLDLGTGTGAIALALASENPEWKVEAIDFNHHAVALAQSNAQRLQINNVNIYQSDWFGNVADKHFNIIVSNPPYIDEDDHHLHEGDVRFEPKSALVAPAQGFADIKHIAEKAWQYLSSEGALFFEHGYDQSKGVQQILLDLGYTQVVTEQDYNDNDRVTWGIKP